MKHYIGCKLVEAEPALRINGEVVQQEEDYIEYPARSNSRRRIPCEISRWV